MKNSDIPAMSNDIDAQTFCDLYSSNIKELEKYRAGLTKREMMAAMLPDVGMEIDSRVVPGFIGRDVNWGDILDGLKASAEVEAIHRVIRADALLAELDRTCQKS